jgi:hypothetical protein
MPDAPPVTTMTRPSSLPGISYSSSNKPASKRSTPLAGLGPPVSAQYFLRTAPVPMGQRVIPAEILGVEHLKNIELMPRIEQRPRVERESAEPSQHVTVGADLELRLIGIKSR